MAVNRAPIVMLVFGLALSACSALFGQGGSADVTVRNETLEPVDVRTGGDNTKRVPAASEITIWANWITDDDKPNFYIHRTSGGTAIAMATCDPYSSRDRKVVWDGTTLRCVGWSGTSRSLSAAASPAPSATAGPTVTPAPTAAPPAVTAAPATTVPASTAQSATLPPAVQPTARPTSPPTVAPTAAPTLAPTPAPTVAPTVNPVRTVRLVNSASQNTHLFGPGETFPCCMVPPGSVRTLTFNAVTTPSVQFRAGRNGAIIAGPITCTFASGTAPSVTYTGSVLRCDAW